MVFGVFDGLHKGHEYFLHTASSQCEKLIVVVTPDSVVYELKHHAPRHSEHERAENIKKFMPDAEVILGDAVVNSWKVLEKHKPGTIFLGYDQQDIATELEKLKMPFVILEAHEPEKYKSSLMTS